jgi:hypothetical protein
MKTIIAVGPHTELHKSSPSLHPAAQVPILYYFPSSVRVFPSCFFSWTFTIKHFSGLHIFRFCHFCYITYSLFNYTMAVCLKNATYDVHNHVIFSILLLPNQFTVTTVHKLLQISPGMSSNDLRCWLSSQLRSFLGWKANVTIICDVTMVFFTILTISFTKLI